MHLADCYCKAMLDPMPQLRHCTCRKGFQHVLSTTNQLLSLIDQAGSSATLDMDNLLLRQSLDVIGLVGFEQDMGATSSLDSSSQASNCLATTIPAMAEIECRFRDPFRGRKFWKKVPAVLILISSSQHGLKQMHSCLHECCTRDTPRVFW